MPSVFGEITVKILDLPFIKGKDVFVNVNMWGDPKKRVYEMELTKTIWFGIHRYLKKLENDPFDMLLPEDKRFKIDEELSFLKNRIITIKATRDETKSFVTKKGEVSYPKIFKVEFRSELEEAEKLGVGSDDYKKAVFQYVIDNLSCRECRLVNTRLGELTEEREKEKQKEKEMTIEERRKRKFEKSEVEWVVKQREEQKLEDSRQRKLGDFAGW